MANIGQLVIAIKTSGVSEAKKQLTELDKLAKSISDANIKASTSAKQAGASAMNPGGKDETEAVKQMFEARARMAVDFYNADVKAHANALRFMVEQERAAWDKIGQIRRGASVSTGGGVTPVPSAGDSGGSHVTGRNGGDDGNTGEFFKRSFKAVLMLKGLEVAAGAVAAGLEGMAVGTLAGFNKSFESVPVVGAFSQLGNSIGFAATGQLLSQMNYATDVKTRGMYLQASSFTAPKYLTELRENRKERDEAFHDIDWNNRYSILSDENAERQNAAAQSLFMAKNVDIINRRKQDLASENASTHAIQGNINAVYAGIRHGDVAGKIANIEAERDAKLEILEIERKTQSIAGDPEKVAIINDKIEKVKSLATIETLAIQKQEMLDTNNINRMTASKAAFNASIGDNTTEEGMKKAKYAKEQADYAAEIKRIEELPSSPKRDADLASTREDKKTSAELESRRLVIEEKMASLRHGAASSAVSEMGLRLKHETLSAENLRDEEATRQRIAAIELSGRAGGAQDIQDEKDMLKGRRAIRDRDLAENKQWGTEEAAIMSNVASRRVSDFQGHIDMIRQKVNEDATKNPELAAQIQARGDAEIELEQRKMRESKQFMAAETAIQERVNSGGITILQGKLEAIRERTRQAIIQNPEMKAELERQGKADEMTTIRENMHLTSVGTVQANLTAFQGGRRVAGAVMPMRGMDDGGAYKMDGTRGETAGKVIAEKQLTALERIESNTRNPVARAG